MSYKPRLYKSTNQLTWSNSNFYNKGTFVNKRERAENLEESEQERKTKTQNCIIKSINVYKVNSWRNNRPQYNPWNIAEYF